MDKLKIWDKSIGRSWVQNGSTGISGTQSLPWMQLKYNYVWNNFLWKRLENWMKRASIIKDKKDSSKKGRRGGDTISAKNKTKHPSIPGVATHNWEASQKSQNFPESGKFVFHIRHPQPLDPAWERWAPKCYALITNRDYVQENQKCREGVHIDFLSLEQCKSTSVKSTWTVCERDPLANLKVLAGEVGKCWDYLWGWRYWQVPYLLMSALLGTNFGTIFNLLEPGWVDPDKNSAQPAAQQHVSAGLGAGPTHTCTTDAALPQQPSQGMSFKHLALEVRGDCASGLHITSPTQGYFKTGTGSWFANI